jgi:3-deoxy-D-manno-octulosonate 8-phosphate phosphatase (KDO 8-P phosphatase)
VLDVDGVLTDGSIIYAGNQVESKHFFVRDGSALKLWRQCGKQAAIISGRNSSIVEARAAELGITPVIQGRFDKLPGYRQILRTTGHAPEQVCFVADDLPDRPILQRCGLAAAVADACPEVLALAHFVSRAPGGRGAVREVIELILRCQGRWQPLLDRIDDEN